MKVLRQLGSCGTALLLGPLLWVGACFTARALAQSGYRQIRPETRAYRVPEAPVSVDGTPVTDPSTLTELKKYVQIWYLEPGACLEFPDPDRWPWSWNPFHASALMLRLKQKQSFLEGHRHIVFHQSIGMARTFPPFEHRYYMRPDPKAALGGRRFIVETKDDEIVRAWELK